MQKFNTGEKINHDSARIYNTRIRSFEKSSIRLAAKLPNPVIETTTKQPDRPITKSQILEQNILRHDQYDVIRLDALMLYKNMSSILDKAGYILADVKLEYGFLENAFIVLADSIGPDECRIWSKKTINLEKYKTATTSRYQIG